MSTSTPVSLSSLAMAVIAKGVKCSDRTNSSRMMQEHGSTCRAAGAGGRGGNAGTSKREETPSNCGWKDRREVRPSMLGASSLLRCSCADQPSPQSKSTVGTGSESLMSAQDPAGSRSFGLLTTQPRSPPTPQTVAGPSSGLQRPRPPESRVPLVHILQRRYCIHISHAMVRSGRL